jgi:DNA topoisomerase I
MDKESSKQALAPAGISIRNGPVNGDMMDVDRFVPNGKRKSRGSTAHSKSYKEQDSSDEEGDNDIKPQVRLSLRNSIPDFLA